MGKTSKQLVLIAALAILFAACSRSEPPPPAPKNVVLFNGTRWLSDGQAISWGLEPGRYKLELTASADGAGVEWLGAPCPGAQETRQYSSVCDLASPGQLIIKNPTTFGLGPASSVMTIITKLAQ